MRYLIVNFCIAFVKMRYFLVKYRENKKEIFEISCNFRRNALLLQSKSVLHWFTEERKARSYD